MKNKRLFVVVVVTVLAGLTVFPMIQRMSTASEVRIIRLYADTIDGKKEIYIEPNTSWVSKDTVVIWVNQARTDEVQRVDAFNIETPDFAGILFHIGIFSHSRFLQCHVRNALGYRKRNELPVFAVVYQDVEVGHFAFAFGIFCMNLIDLF